MAESKNMASEVEKLLAIFEELILGHKLRPDQKDALQHKISPLFTTYIDSVVQQKSKVTGETSDGYHTFNELYDYRRVYNAALFNEWAAQGKYDVHKSYKHSDGELPFGGGWFVVVAELPTGQITNHYENKYWDDFQIPEKDKANEWDGHTPQEALDRLTTLRHRYEQMKGEKND